MRRYAAALALPLVLVVLTILVLRTGLNVSTPLVVVEGNSMIPTLYNGDLVLIHKPPADEIRVGDIVVYRSPVTGRLVIHRVVKVLESEQNDGTVIYRYITRGDNNPVDDVAQGLEPPGGIPYEDILGVVVSIHYKGLTVPLRIPYLGLLTRLVRG